MIKYIHYGVDFLKEVLAEKGYTGTGWGQHGYARQVFSLESGDCIDAWEILEEVDGHTYFEDLADIRRQRLDEGSLYIRTREVEDLVIDDMHAAVDTPERMSLSLYEIDSQARSILTDKMGIVGYDAHKEGCETRYFVFLPEKKARRILSLMEDWWVETACPYCTDGKELAELTNMIDHDETITLAMEGTNIELTTTYGPLTLSKKTRINYCPMCGKEL